jgi:hypothetical protein
VVQAFLCAPQGVDRLLPLWRQFGGHAGGAAREDDPELSESCRLLNRYFERANLSILLNVKLGMG